MRSSGSQSLGGAKQPGRCHDGVRSQPELHGQREDTDNFFLAFKLHSCCLAAQSPFPSAFLYYEKFVIAMSISTSHQQNSTRSDEAESCEDQRSKKQYDNPLAGFFDRRKWHDDRYEHFIRPGLEDFPLGYPRLAARQNSDVNTLLFRRFGWLRCRTLLHLQDEIQVLETNLCELDRKHAIEAPYRLKSRRIDETLLDETTAYTRTAMMKEIRLKLDVYDDLLARQHSISALPKPERSMFRSHFDWITNEAPLLKEETDFLRHWDDFLHLGEPPDSACFVSVVSTILPGWMKKVRITTN